MVRICSLKQHVKVCKKEPNYKNAMKALCDGRENNPAHEDAFNLLITNLKKKNPHRKSADEHSSPSRALFTEENTNGRMLIHV